MAIMNLSFFSALLVYVLIFMGREVEIYKNDFTIDKPKFQRSLFQIRKGNRGRADR